MDKESWAVICWRKNFGTKESIFVKSKDEAFENARNLSLKIENSRVDVGKHGIIRRIYENGEIVREFPQQPFIEKISD